MVISNLNTKMIRDRLGFINESVQNLKRLASLGEGGFLKNDLPAAAESYLRRSLEAMFDIGRHIIAKMAGKGVVEYRDIASTLYDLRILRKGTATKMRLMAGYRNRMVHYYHEITAKELYSIIRKNLKDIEDFIKDINRFISKYEKEKPARPSSLTPRNSFR